MSDSLAKVEDPAVRRILGAMLEDHGIVREGQEGALEYGDRALKAEIKIGMIILATRYRDAILEGEDEQE